ncbi:MAG: AAA family ATPase [Thermoplasmataceae archaeon]
MKIHSVKIQNVKILESVDIEPRMINVIVGRNNIGKTSFLEAIAVALIPGFTDKYLNQPSSIINYGKTHAEITLKINEGSNRDVKVNLDYALPNELVREILRELKDWAIIRDDESRYLSTSRKVKIIPSDLSERVDIALQSVEAILQQDLKVGKYDRIFLKDSLFFDVNDLKMLMKGRNYLKELRKLQLQFADLAVSDLGGSQSKILAQAILEDRDRFASQNRYTGRGGMRGEDQTKNIDVHFIHDPLDNLEQLKTSTEAKETLTKAIEDIIIDEGLMHNLIRFGFSSMVLKIGDEVVEVPIDSMGDGFKSLLSIIASIQRYQRDCVFLIEEPEVHMHPGYIQELTKYLIALSRKFKIQLFISTYSLDFINSILYDDSINDEDKEFIKSEFLLLRFDKFGETIVVESKDFDRSREEINLLSNDLRGI